MTAVKRSAPRRLAAEILAAIEEQGAFSNHLLNARAGQLEGERDRRFLRELVYGVLENRRYLDFMLDRVSSRKMRRLRPMLRQILRIGCYELIFLNTPSHAAVNEAVESVRAIDLHAAGLAHAVLRKADRGRGETAGIRGADAVKRLRLGLIGRAH